MLRNRMCDFRSITAFLILALQSLSATADDQKSLVLLTEQNPPAAYRDPTTGRISGGAVDVVHVLMQSSGISYSLSILPWNRAYRRAMIEKNACVFPTNKTPERDDQFEWISPIIEGSWVIFKRPDSRINIAKFSDLRGQAIVGIMDSTAPTIIENELGQPIARAVDGIAAAKLLYGGRVDLWLSGRTTGAQAAMEAGLPVPAIAFTWKESELGIACHLDTDPSILEQLRRANDERLAASLPAETP